MCFLAQQKGVKMKHNKETVPASHTLAFEPKTERDWYLQQRDRTKAGTADTFIRIWLRMRHFPDLNRRDILVFSAIRATMNAKSASNSTVVTVKCIAHRLDCDTSTVYLSLRRLRNMHIISYGKAMSGQRTICVERDFSKPQPEEIGMAAENPLVFVEPEGGHDVSTSFMKIYDRLINYTDLTEMDRLTYSAICFYADADKKGTTTGLKDEPRTTRVKSTAIAHSIHADPRSVNTSIKHLEALGVIGIKRGDSWREISILRDFSEPQPEEIAYYNEHGGSFDTGIEEPFSMTDEEFDELPF